MAVTTLPGTATGGTLGRLLREWRATRGMSQLDLSLEAGMSARHLSFIETGRSQPSRQALLDLAEALDMPLRDRNRLLEAGGYARYYRETPFDAEALRHVRGLLQFLLDRHEPYGAVVIDRYSNLLVANTPATRLFGNLVDPSLLTGTLNVLRATFHPLGLRRRIANWDEVAHHLLGRARRELGSDEDGEALLREIEGYGALAVRTSAPGAISAGDLLLPVHVATDDGDLRLFSAIMTLGTPQDVTLQELRVETFFPADAASERVWRRLSSREG